MKKKGAVMTRKLTVTLTEEMARMLKMQAAKEFTTISEVLMRALRKEFNVKGEGEKH